MMPTRPLIVSIAITHGPMPDGVASEKRNGSSDAFMPAEPADDRPAERNQHERQHDDENALKEIGPCRGDEAADEAVEDEHDGHGHDDLVHADRRRPSPG